LEELRLTSGHDGFSLSALRSPPTGPRRGGVIVLQEVFGVSPHIQSVMRFFASEGYEAIAPSLFDRIERRFSVEHDAEGLETGIAAARATPARQAIGDMAAALAVLKEGPKYAVGFCFGGVMAWLAAQHCAGLNAAAGFYGRRIIDHLQEPLRAPTMLHYGDHDSSIPLSDVEQVCATRPEARVFIYEAGHAFCREDGPNFCAPARDLAFDRTLSFFEAHTASI